MSGLDHNEPEYMTKEIGSVLWDGILIRKKQKTLADKKNL